MTIEYYVNKIKLMLTGGVLQSEIDDEGFAAIVKMALQEVNRYYDATQLVTVPASGCIDLAEVEEANGIKINTVSAIYREHGIGTTTSAENYSDPMAIAYWNMANNFGGYGTTKWAYRYLAYNTAQQVSNTLSTDLSFKEDKLGRKLYVNYSGGNASALTVEYIPELEVVDQVIGDYWVDILFKLSLAYSKIALGRIRTRYTQSNALWTQDGETLLTEGNAELADLRDRLRTKANFVYPVD